jgi:hypothetical protein
MTEAQRHNQDIADLVNVTQRLIELITAEVAALRTMRLADVAQIQTEKAALASRYESELIQLKELSIKPGDVDQATLAALTDSTQSLTAALADNRRALHAARTVNQKLMETIATEIARQRNPGDSYSNAGSVEPAALSRRYCGPLQLDERV